MKKILFFILIVSAACTTSKTVTEKSKEKPTEKITVEITEDDNINFEIINNSDQPVYLYQASELVIEKFDHEKWESVKILNCPCDAPCKAPEEKYLLKENHSYRLSWNKKMSWCGKRGEGLVRETVTRPAEKGTYRLVIKLYNAGKVAETVYKEFKI